MKNKFVRAMCALISAAFLSSCGVITINSPAAPPETEAETDGGAGSSYEVSEYEKWSENYGKETKAFLRDLEKADYNGAVFQIATAKAGTVMPDESIGAVISASFAERNAAIEDHFNISITEKVVNIDTMYDEAVAAVKAGEYYADLIMLPQSYICSFATRGILLNLNTLPNFNYEGGYYSETGLQSGGGFGKLYAVSGPASLTLDTASVVYFNRGLIDSSELESLYSLVDGGDWTWDKFKEYCSAAANLGVYSFGTQNNQINFPDTVYFSCGGRFVMSEAGGAPTVCMNADFGNTVTALCASLLADPLYYSDSMSAIEAFSSGKMMFLIDNAETMKTLANSEVAWGVLPLPKYSAEQEGYYTLASDTNSMFFACLPTVTDVGRVSNVLAMLNISSYGEQGDDLALDAQSYYLRDNESARMLDIALDGVVYDFAYSFSPYHQAVSSISYVALRNPTQGMSTVTGYLNTWTGAFNTAVYRLFN